MNALKALVTPRSARSNVGAAGGVGASKANCDLSGWLHKKGETNTAFKHRFFVLARGLLSYYEDEQASNAKGELNILGATCEVAKACTAGRFRFEVCVREKGVEGRVYVLEASDVESREQWISALLLSSAATGSIALPEGIDLEAVIGPAPTRTWREEWTSMRMETLRLSGDPARANRKECGPGGPEGVDTWSALRSASIAWKKAEGWADEDASGYTLLTACNGPALSRSVREKSGQYAASLHLITRSLASNVDRMAEPAPPLYYKLCGRNGLATIDSAWAALLRPGAKPGVTKFVTTSVACGRNHPKCFSTFGKEGECQGYHDMFIGGKDPATGEQQYIFDLCVSPVVKYVSAPTTAAGVEGPASIYRTFVKVDGHGNRWEAPALATVSLVSIEQPGTWGAFDAAKVNRLCYTVSVAWSAGAGAAAPAAAAAAPLPTAIASNDQLTASDKMPPPLPSSDNLTVDKEPVDIE